MPDAKRKPFHEQVFSQLRRSLEAALEDHPELRAISVTMVWDQTYTGLPTGLFVVPAGESADNVPLVFSCVEEGLKNIRSLLAMALEMLARSKGVLQTERHNHESEERRPQDSSGTLGKGTADQEG